MWVKTPLFTLLREINFMDTKDKGMKSDIGTLKLTMLCVVSLNHFEMGFFTLNFR